MRIIVTLASFFGAWIFLSKFKGLESNVFIVGGMDISWAFVLALIVGLGAFNLGQGKN
jgi:hypothetical protein